MSNINDKPELHAVKDGIQAIKEGLTERSEKIEQIEARIDALDEAMPRALASEKVYTTGDASRDAGARTLGSTIAQAFRKFDGKAVSRDFDNGSTSGGVLVPTPTFAGVQRLLEERSLARQLCRVLPMTSETLVVPTVTGIVSGSWISTQGTAVPEDTTTAFGTKANNTLTANTVAVLGKISRELDADAIVAMETVLGEIYADAIANAENEAFLTQDGPSSGTANQGPFIGIFADDDLLKVTDTPASASEADMGDVLSYANLVALQNGLKSTAMGRASWIMHPTVWAEVAKLSTGISGDVTPLLGPISGQISALSAGFEKTLLGRPVYLSDSAPAWSNSATSSDTAFIAYGDWATTCVMGDRQQIEVEVSDHVYMATRERALMVSARVGFLNNLPGSASAGYSAGVLTTNPS